MSWILWVGFIGFLFALLALDLGVFNRRPHIISAREALGWTAFWILLALLFNVAVFFAYDHHWFGVGSSGQAAMGGEQAFFEFLVAYVVEKSLSLDNIFVMTLIFAYFDVPPQFQHRVLFWGILGALVMRGIMIFGGLALIQMFSWTTYLFGIVLLVTAAKMALSKDEAFDPEQSFLIRVARRRFPVTSGYRAQHFFVREGGRVWATPLFLSVVLVEGADIVFAVDSIPAVFGVTQDPFIVFSSNVFAIFGLRSLYFAFAVIVRRFRYLNVSMIVLLAFIGLKMLLAHHIEIPTWVSLSTIGGILGVGIAASLLRSPEDESS